LVGLLGFGWALRHEMTRLRADTEAIHLLPVDEQTRSARPEDTIGRDGTFLLILDVLASKSYPADAEYRLEVRTADGREVRTLREVRPDRNGTFTLEIPRRALPAGEYRIVLFGPQGERISEYLLRIDPESP
jgi:hypothetical protein